MKFESDPIFILVPYDSGHRGARMGRGPLHLSEHGARERLRARGHVVSETTVDVSTTFPTELGTSFALYRALSDRVSSAVTGGSFPIVLAGNCGSSLGTVSGVRAASPNDRSGLGVIWLDAHADFNTPETTTTGFLDGTGLAALTGRCWRALAASIPGFRPVSDAHVVLVGARDIDPGEERELASSRVMRVEAARMQADGAAAALHSALTELARHVSRVYLHIDLDVHEPGEAQANQYAVPGGLSAETVRDLVRVVGERFSIVAAALTSYDPTCDPRMLDVALRLVEEVASCCVHAGSFRAEARSAAGEESRSSR
jgi:arginase